MHWIINSQLPSMTVSSINDWRCGSEHLSWKMTAWGLAPCCWRHS